ncbi:28S rRNA (cytosine-C(5))-methyltransferase-like isoform X2 [Liolophura sinensis]|uniref:28S rRNA (cytosine-C(5))-methyltransferase-like isoform X2 n=1 Tax=Liolophura sinensis TaxID=3198878 RepID=UPI00315813EF
MGLYNEAADIIRKVKAKESSVKTLVLSKSTYPNKKQLYALVCETLKNTELLKRIEDKLDLLKKEDILDGNEDLLHVLLYDQLIGRGIKGAHSYRIAIQRYRSVLKAEFKKLQAEDQAELKTVRTNDLPRYARVNLLKTTVTEVTAALEEDGWRLLVDRRTEAVQTKFADVVSKLSEGEFMLDPDIPDLVVFPPHTDLHDHRLFVSGEIILQDKASCFPAHILSPPEGAAVIDCCAAPGNKTSHIASLIQNNGRIFAFDKKKARLSTMERLLSKAGVTCATIQHQDFLQVKANDPVYKDVGYILVDPSCSGSGMVNRLNEKIEDSQERLTSLSHFQISILKHALSFPGIQRVVYSTCSIHQEENEMVVDEVMSQFKGKFFLKEVYPDWTNRGVKGNPCWKECIRMSPDLDLTNGFFVACFERSLCETRSTTTTTDSESKSFDQKPKKRKKKFKDLEKVTSAEDYSDSTVITEQELPKRKKKKSKKHKHENENHFENFSTKNCSEEPEPESVVHVMTKCKKHKKKKHKVKKSSVEK